jgi:short-subunit dehydrogenase
MSAGRETVLVSGASSGIGLELARLFAADGADLVLVARRRDELETLAAELRARHRVGARVETADLADAAAPAQLFERLDGAGVVVDVLVNNAGFGAIGPVATLPAQRQLDMVRVNVAALTHLSRLFLPGMLGRRQGGILNVSSTAAFQPGANMAVYYATKAYVLSFSEALAEEVRGAGVTITCLCPGPTHTGFRAEAGMEGVRLFRLGAMDAVSVARVGHRGFRNGRTVVIAGATNKVVPFLERFVPRLLVRKVAKRLNVIDPVRS